MLSYDDKNINFTQLARTKDNIIKMLFSQIDGRLKNNEGVTPFDCFCIPYDNVEQITENCNLPIADVISVITSAPLYDWYLDPVTIVPSAPIDVEISYQVMYG